MAAKSSGTQHSIRVGGEFDPGDGIAMSDLADISIDKGKGLKNERLTGSSSALIAKSGMRTAQSESEDDASR